MIGQNLTKKSHLTKKNRIQDGFVIILLSSDASRIIEIISGDIWEGMESVKMAIARSHLYAFTSEEIRVE